MKLMELLEEEKRSSFIFYFQQYDFLKSNHNCDAYMGVKKESSTFLNAFQHREKQARSLFAA